MSILINNLYFLSAEESAESYETTFYYLVEGQTYDAERLERESYPQGQQVVPFSVDLNRSRILALVLERGYSPNIISNLISNNTTYTVMLYQWDFNEQRLYELTPRPHGYQNILDVNHIDVPDLTAPRGQFDLPSYELEEPNEILFLIRLNFPEDRSLPNGLTDQVFDEILHIHTTQSIDNLYYLVQNNRPEYYYLIGDYYYNAVDLRRRVLTEISMNSLTQFPQFQIHLTGDKPIILLFGDNQRHFFPMVYQRYDLNLTELTPRPPSTYNIIRAVTEIEVPSHDTERLPLYSNLGILTSLRGLLNVPQDPIFLDEIVNIQPTPTALPTIQPSAAALPSTTTLPIPAALPGAPTLQPPTPMSLPGAPTLQPMSLPGAPTIPQLPEVINLGDQYTSEEGFDLQQLYYFQRNRIQNERSTQLSNLYPHLNLVVMGPISNSDNVARTILSALRDNVGRLTQTEHQLFMRLAARYPLTPQQLQVVEHIQREAQRRPLNPVDIDILARFDPQLLGQLLANPIPSPINTPHLTNLDNRDLQELLSLQQQQIAGTLNEYGRQRLQRLTTKFPDLNLVNINSADFERALLRHFVRQRPLRGFNIDEASIYRHLLEAYPEEEIPGSELELLLLRQRNSAIPNLQPPIMIPIQESQDIPRPTTMSYNERTLQHLQREARRRTLTPNETETLRALTTGTQTLSLGLTGVISMESVTELLRQVQNIRNSAQPVSETSTIINVENLERIKAELSRFESETRDQKLLSEIRGALSFINSKLMTLTQTRSFVQSSYEILLSRLYNLPIEIPRQLIINSVFVPFISFQDAYNKIMNNEIIKWIIDPILQSWANDDNIILSLYDKDGVVSLVKVKYNPNTKQISPPT